MNVMTDFIRIGTQTARHKSGYSVFWSGRYFLAYKELDEIYKVYCEHILITDKNEDALCIYTSTLYDENEKEIQTNEEERKTIVNRVALGASFLIDFIIILSDRNGNRTTLSKY